MVTLSTFLQVPLKALAVATVGIFKHRQFALAIAAHDGERVLQRQGIELDGGEFVHPLFGQVAAVAHIDDVALHQVVGLGVGVIDLGAVDPDFVQARDHRLGDFVNRLELRYAFGQIFADDGLLSSGAQCSHGQVVPSSAGKKREIMEVPWLV